TSRSEPPASRRWWREMLADSPISLRQAWGERANAYQFDAGMPVWEAEERAAVEVLRGGGAGEGDNLPLKGVHRCQNQNDRPTTGEPSRRPESRPLPDRFGTR